MKTVRFRRVREFAAHFGEVFGVRVSKETISRIAAFDPSARTFSTWSVSPRQPKAERHNRTSLQRRACGHFAISDLQHAVVARLRGVGIGMEVRRVQEGRKKAVVVTALKVKANPTAVQAFEQSLTLEQSAVTEEFSLMWTERA